MRELGFSSSEPLRLKTVNYWYSPIYNNTSTSALTANRLYAIPFPIGFSGVISGVAINCTTSAAGNVLRIGIYDSTSGGLPGSLVSAFGSVAGTSTGMKTITGLSVSVVPKLYWLACVNQTSAATWRAGGIGHPLVPDFTATPVDTTPCSLAIDGVSGALPNSFGTPTVLAATAPAIKVRFSS